MRIKTRGQDQGTENNNFKMGSNGHLAISTPTGSRLGKVGELNPWCELRRNRGARGQLRCLSDWFCSHNKVCVGGGGGA